MTNSSFTLFLDLRDILNLTRLLTGLCDPPHPNPSQLLHVDVSILEAASRRLDSALKVCFSPASTEHLLVATSANKIVWLSAKTGHLLREVTLMGLVPQVEYFQG